MHRATILGSFAAGLALLLVPTAARADCANGADYSAQVSASDAGTGGNSVTVCLMYTKATYTCGQSGGIVRQNEQTGELDQLADFCVASSYGGGPCYLDECVPPGTYRYGLATAFDCSQAGCGTVGLFTEATVTTPLPADCERSMGNSAPVETSTPAPWGSGEDPTSEKNCGGCGCTSTTDSAVLSVDAAAIVLGVGIWFGSRRRARRA
jgi:hypothetical protein